MLIATKHNIMMIYTEQYLPIVTQLFFHGLARSQNRLEPSYLLFYYV